jgi:hypothetical protein
LVDEKACLTLGACTIIVRPMRPNRVICLRQVPQTPSTHARLCQPVTTTTSYRHTQVNVQTKGSSGRRRDRVRSSWQEQPNGIKGVATKGNLTNPFLGSREPCQMTRPQASSDAGRAVSMPG